MKILYYASVNSRKESGVLKKIYSQAAQWQLQGAEVILLTIGTAKSSAPLIAPPEGLLHNEVNSRIAALFSGSFFKLLNRCLTIFRVRKLIKIHSPDIIYMRDCIWFPFMLILFDCRIPVVMEINSLLKNELKYFGLIRRLMYGFFQHRIYRRAAGFIGISEQVADSLAAYKKPSATIANGFDFAKQPAMTIPTRPAVKEEEKLSRRPALVFVGSPGMKWQGLDHVQELARRLPEFDFHIVGEREIGKASLKNLIFHGYLGYREVEALYARMDIGIGSLALYRLQMRQGSPLKVREYLAFGLPVMIGYEDADISGKALDFVLQVDPFSLGSADALGRIRSFVFHWQGKRVSADIVEPLVGMPGKEKARLAFFKRIIAN